MQPSGRVSEEGKLIQPVEALEWDAVRISGKNGFLLVVTLLGCWGKCIAKDPPCSAEYSDWVAAIRDVSWVLEHIIRSSKEGSDASESAPPTPAKEV